MGPNVRCRMLLFTRDKTVLYHIKFMSSEGALLKIAQMLSDENTVNIPSVPAIESNGSSI